MKITKGRLSSLPVVFKYFLDETIMINLTKEKVTIFYDGTYKQTKSGQKRRTNETTICKT